MDRNAKNIRAKRFVLHIQNAAAILGPAIEPVEPRASFHQQMIKLQRREDRLAGRLHDQPGTDRPRLWGFIVNNDAMTCPRQKRRSSQSRNARPPNGDFHHAQLSLPLIDETTLIRAFCR